MAPRLVPRPGGCLILGAARNGLLVVELSLGRHKDCDRVDAGGGPGGGGGSGIPGSQYGWSGGLFDGLADEEALTPIAPVEAALREAGGRNDESILSGSNACAVCCCRVSIALAGVVELLGVLPLKEIADSIRSA